MCAGRMLGGPIVCTAKASIDDGDSRIGAGEMGRGGV